jgi:hypothetical protein
MLVPAGVEEALFKPAATGWIFSAPNPWTFAPRRSYLVDDVQKADLALRVRRGRYLRLLALIPIFALQVPMFLLFPFLLRAPSVGTWLLLALFVVFITVAMNLCDYLAVRPLLTGLPRTAERISLVEMYARQARSMSIKALATVTVIETLACALMFGDWLLSPRHSPHTLVGAACLGTMAILLTAMLLAKLKTQETAA